MRLDKVRRFNLKQSNSKIRVLCVSIIIVYKFLLKTHTKKHYGRPVAERSEASSRPTITRERSERVREHINSNLKDLNLMGAMFDEQTSNRNNILMNRQIQSF